MSTDFSGMIAFAQSLAETVKQAQTATEALAAREIDYAALKHDYETVCADRNDWRNDAQSNADHIVALKAELAASEVRNREVSEALARANAKLDSFRQLLGVDGGTSAPVPTPAVLPEQSTHTIAEPPHEAQPVDPAVAGGTGGVAPNDPPQVNQTAYNFVTAEPASTRHVEPEPHSPDPSGGTAETHAADSKNEPTPAPEVAEPRPTNPSGETGQAGMTGTQPLGASEPVKPEGGPLSWRDSASHVAYRPFSYGG